MGRMNPGASRVRRFGFEAQGIESSAYPYPAGVTILFRRTEGPRQR